MEDKKTGTPAMLRAAVTGEVDMSAAVPGGIEASEKLGQNSACQFNQDADRVATEP